LEVALKIDVDTHRGLAEGVPRLARMLERERVAASFYVAMGPDNSGRALVRLFKNPGFLRKMLRTRAVETYGLRTVLSGTLLPARPVGAAFPTLLRELRERGFEVGVHGYDHVKWQDQLDALGENGVRAEVHDAFEAYRAIFGEPARAFAAPGWRTNTVAMTVLDTMGLSYRSDTRGAGPYRCAVDGRVLATPEIPTTLPTLDEVVGRREVRDSAALLKFFIERFKDETLNVHTAHAETEGMAQLEWFTALVRSLKERGAKFVRLAEVAKRLSVAELPVCEVVRGTIEGRAGWVAMQKVARALTPNNMR
jgi:peptidoglycan/xylan/chitin deacetylase (PgdA/CDA1 family)